MSSRNELKNIIGQSFVWLVIFATSICVFVPFSPTTFPGTMDQSWAFGINQAVAQGLSFGKEIIFTYGPYASILTETYHPATDFMMLGGSLYLALSYGAYIAILAKGVQWRWVLIYCGALAGMLFSRDALLFSLPLLAGLSIFKIQSTEDGTIFTSRLAPVYLALLFAPFGLLPLIKGTLFILCGAVSFLCFALFIANKRRQLAIVCLCAPVVSALFFWTAAGQSTASFPNYVITLVPIVFGYTDAMSSEGASHDWALYLAVSALILLTIANQTQVSKKSRLFVTCIYFVFLFVSFKAGFVRHDHAHAVISGAFIFIAALLLQFVFHAKAIRLTIVFALFSWISAAILFEPDYGKIPVDIASKIGATYFSTISSIDGRLANKNWPRVEFDAMESAVRSSAPLPIMQGTTDIYSNGQSQLISSGNTWSPRPILQSYSAYTPELAEINREHLLGARAPDNIIFKVEPIDERLPSIEDGASWPILLLNYRPAGMANDYLLLKKMGSITDLSNHGEPIRQHRTFGEKVDLPASSGPLFAEIEINPSILGRIESFFFKPSLLRITLELENDRKIRGRIIPAMVKSKFLISPLIEDTSEFKALFDADSTLPGRKVKSIVIAPYGSTFNLWNADYTIGFSQIAPAQSDETTKNKDLPDLRTAYRIQKAN